MSSTDPRLKRKARIRRKLSGTAERPRLTVYKKEDAKRVGRLVAEKAKAAKVTRVVFDRNGFPFQGRIAAVAEAAREAGLEF